MGAFCVMRFSFFRFAVLALLIFFTDTSTSWCEEPWAESPELAALFKNADIEGTFVLYDVNDDSFIGHDETRAKKRFIPASTFKIPNSLIGLSVGAVKNVDEILPYGGEKQPIASWERDMSLRDAIKISNVAIYQELARRIGLENMQKGVSALHYGNAEIGKTADIFWLEGPLEISAIEQTRFLADLARKKLPFPAEAQEAVRDIIMTEQGGGWTLFAKTGTVARQRPRVGWWVGWVEKNDRIYSFAINLSMHKSEDADKRAGLGRACLQALGIL